MSEIKSLLSSLDFTSLPLQETADALRSVGQNLLLDLLKGRERPFLAPLLPDRIITLLTDSINAMQNRSPRYGYTQLVNQIPLSDEDWLTAVAEAISQTIYDDKPLSYLPAFMWPFISKLSWEQLDVQFETAHEIYKYLKQYYLFWPDFGELPALHVNTYWALIMLADDKPPDHQAQDT